MIAEIVFFAALALLAYTFAGYAVLVEVWARVANRAVRPGRFEPQVAIVVVVHNGAAIIRAKIESCLAQDYPAGRLRVLVVSDGSDDDTCAIVTAMGDARVRLLAFPNRRGKAACLNDAARECDEEVIVFTDARQPLDPKAVRLLVANLADPDVGAVSGGLVFVREGMSGFGASIDAYWRLEKRLRKAEARVHSSVGVTGAIYAIRRAHFHEIPADTVLDDVLIPMQAVMDGKRVVFEEGAIAYDRVASDFRDERRRKVRTLGGNFQLFARHPEFLAPWRCPIALQAISHKVLRLAAPLLLAALAAASVILAPHGWFYAATLWAQVACYALALLGALWPAAKAFAPVRLTNAFVALNWCVVLGFVEFATNPEAHLWKAAAPSRTST